MHNVCNSAKIRNFPYGGVKSKETTTYINFTSHDYTTEIRQTEKHKDIYRQQPHGRQECKRPSFSSQKTTFQLLIHALLQAQRRPFAKPLGIAHQSIKNKK